MEEEKMNENSCNCGPNCNCKSKKNTPAIIMAVVVFLLLAVIGALVFFVCTKKDVFLLTIDDTTKVNTQTSLNQTVIENTAVVENTTVVENTQTTTNNASSADIAYQNYIKGLKKSLDSFPEYLEDESLTKYKTFIGFTDSIVESDFQHNWEHTISIERNGDAVISTDDNSYFRKALGEKYKFGSNIVKLGVCQGGQDCQAIWMIDTNGKLYYIDVPSRMKEDEVSEIKLKNIVDVISSNTDSPYAVDIEGKLYRLFEYI